MPSKSVRAAGPCVGTWMNERDATETKKRELRSRSVVAVAISLDRGGAYFYLVRARVGTAGTSS